MCGVEFRIPQYPLVSRVRKGCRVQISLPNEVLSLNVKGTVIWSRRINIEEETTVALGMRFQKMSPKARGILLGFANNLEKFEEISQN